MKDYTESHKRQEKGRQYDEHYDRDPWHRFLWSREQIALKKLIDKYYHDKEIHLLDFACGTGRIASFLENYTTTSVGVDVSSSMLETARRKLKKTELFKGNIIKEDFLKGQRFNLIIAFRFFLNAEQELRQGALNALIPLLDKDGFFVFNNHRNGTSPLVRYKYSKRRRKRNFLSMQEMHDLVNSVGLEIIEVFPIGYFPFHKRKVPQLFNDFIDNIGNRFKCLYDYSESPIAVCRFSHKF